jgi:ABC transport system ATP-binding/permease protein
VLSKFTLLALVCALQCTVLLGIVFPVLGLANNDPKVFGMMLGYMTVTAVCAAAIGLLLSTVVTSSEAAMALTPIALIPQVVLGGRIVPMTNKSWLQYVMSAIPSRWSFEGLLASERDKLAQAWKIKTCLPPSKTLVEGKLNCALEEVSNTLKGGGGLGFSTYNQPLVSFGVLAGMTLVCVVTVMILLRRRDSV